MTDDLEELISMYREGNWSDGDFWHQVTLLVPRNPVQLIIDHLPVDLVGGFRSWLYHTFDNDHDADAFIHVGTRGKPPQNRERIDAIRSWLRASRT